jgi:drug/metabolite transporter (DMT)-like permease
VGLSILGVGVIFYEGLRLEGASLIGDLLVLLAAMGFGAYTVLSMRVLGRYSSLAVATYPILFGAPSCCWSPSRSSRDWEWEGVGMGAWAAVVFSTVFATAFAFSAWQTDVSRIGANRVLVYQYLISLTGVASGIIFFGEVLGFEKLLGGAVTLLGVYLARRQ